METAGTLNLSRVRRVALAAGLTLLAALLASAAANALPRKLGAHAAGSSGSFVFAQAPEWIPAHDGNYGTDPSSPGPGVTVDVPNAGGQMGFIEVWARVRANSHTTAVGLFDVTGHVRRFVDGQDDLCTYGSTLPGDLFMTLEGVPGVYGTPLQPGFACAGTPGAPGPVLFRVPAGERRLRLEYADCGCAGNGYVSHRWLWIRPVQPSRSAVAD